MRYLIGKPNREGGSYLRASLVPPAWAGWALCACGAHGMGRWPAGVGARL